MALVRANSLSLALVRANPLSLALVRANPLSLALVRANPLSLALVRANSLSLALSVTTGVAALTTELRKHSSNDTKCKELDWVCVPLVVESYGAWGKEALESISQLASRLATCSSKAKSVVLTELYGRLNLHLVRANAIAILACSLGQSDFSPLCRFLDIYYSLPRFEPTFGFSRVSDGSQMVVGLNTAGGSCCPFCPDTVLDPLGHHAVSCRHGGFVVTRHNLLRDILAGFCRRAHLSVKIEVGYGLSRENINSRPADILVQSWDRGHPAAFDVTVTSPLTPAILNISSIYEGAAGRVAEARKHTTNDAKCQDLGWLCIPLAVETYGNWGKEAHEVFNRLASLLAFGQTSHKSGLLLEIYSHVNMSLVRSIARAILGRALVMLLLSLMQVSEGRFVCAQAIDMFNCLVASSDVISVENLLSSCYVHQKALSEKLDDHQFNLLLNCSSVADRARLLSVSSPFAASWLSVIPSEGLGLHLTAPIFQVALKWWLGLDTSGGSQCSLCPGSVLDHLSHHAVTCKRGGDVVTRHNRLRDCIVEVCRRAHIGVQVEVGNNLTPSHSKTHPADILIPNWVMGRTAALDVSVTSPLNPQTLLEAGVTATAAALTTEERKHDENDPKCSELGWVCIPVVAESYGAWGREATLLFSTIASRIATLSNKPKSVTLIDIYGRLNLQLVRANATSILARLMPPSY
ncbi:hypothetical protein EMCRGX_G026190 [Ephydatia muelleri]